MRLSLDGLVAKDEQSRCGHVPAVTRRRTRAKRMKDPERSVVGCRRSWRARGRSQPWRYLIVALVVLQSGASSAQPAAPVVWISPLDPQWRKAWSFPPNDWDQLFEPKAPWPTVVSRIHVFEFSKRFVMEADDVELRRVLAFLKEHNIK